MNTRKLKQSIKRASKVGRNGSKKALPIVKAIVPTAFTMVVDTLPGAPILRLAMAVIAKNQQK